MTYRVYVRWGQGERVSDKTVTYSPVVAEAAYRLGIFPNGSKSA